MIQKKPKELLLAVLHMPIRLATKSIPLAAAALLYLGYQGYDAYTTHIKELDTLPRQAHAQELVSDMVTNGMEICDPDRQAGRAEQRLRRGLNATMFRDPEKVGDAIDVENVRNGLAMQWATSMGTKICTDIQMDRRTAVIWHPKEKILAVNGNMNIELLSRHLRVAMIELMDRSSNERYSRNSTAPGGVMGKAPLSEKFAVSVRPTFPEKNMVVTMSDMTPAQRNITPPVRPGPKAGS